MKNKTKYLEGYSYKHTLDCLSNKLNNYIDVKGYKDWYVVVIMDGLKTINATTSQYATWNFYDYDEDCEVIQNKIKKFLDWNNQH